MMKFMDGSTFHGYRDISYSRLKNALFADAIFEFKQGFHFIYLVISFLYLLALSQIPEQYVVYILPLLIFSDPSVLGLFFIGGIILLEKEQGILQSIVVTPLSTLEYITSKVISLTLIAIMASLVISVMSYQGSVNYFFLIAGIIVTSVFFTLIGFLIACKSTTVNMFFLRMVPYIMVLVLPCLLLIWQYDLFALNLIPSIACFRLVFGAYHGQSWGMGIFQLVYMTIIDMMLLKYIIAKFEEYIVYGG